MSNASRTTPADDPDIHRIDDDDRYGSLRLIGWWRQERLAASRVLVVGAGALGNEVVKNLALIGVGSVLLIDMDTIEPGNLSRSVLFRREDEGQPKAVVASRRAREINPEVRLIPVVGNVLDDLGLAVFAEADVVIGCLDNREARLWLNRQCWKVNTPWVDAGIQEIQGVVKVFVPPDSPCYECAMTARDYQLLNVRYSCPLLPRDEILAGKVPTAPTIASMMAALQVQEALKLLHDLPVAAGSALVFNGVTNQFYQTQLPRRDDCLSHETYPEPVRLPLGHQARAADLFAQARPWLGGGPLTLALDRDLVLAIECPACGATRAVHRPRTAVPLAEATCARCGQPGRPLILNQVEEGSPPADLPLAGLGIPAYDLVRIDGPEGSGFFLLAGDPSPWDGAGEGTQ